MGNSSPFHPDQFIVRPGTKVRLSDHPTRCPSGFATKSEASEALETNIRHLSDAQERLWASKEYSLLIILQAMDAAGKDGAIKHVMRGINPQGCSVTSFGPPNEEERLHHFLWRPFRHLPERGRIAIFNRSYYEEVLVVRVHPKWLDKQWIPKELRSGSLDGLWEKRFADINQFEKHLTDNATTVVKVFLHLSRKEQRKRLLSRLDDPHKNWKFTEADVRERAHWDEYTNAYEQMLTNTSTERAPWYIIPADRKWFSRAAIAATIASHIDAMSVKFPTADPQLVKRFPEFRKTLLSD